jgi:hypothetical protein
VSQYCNELKAEGQKNRGLIPVSCKALVLFIDSGPALKSIKPSFKGVPTSVSSEVSVSGWEGGIERGGEAKSEWSYTSIYGLHEPNAIK